VKTTLSVPTINDYTAADFDVLFNLWNQVNNDNLDVTFEFRGCRFLRHNAVAFFGDLTHLIQCRGGIVRFALDTISQKVKTSLAQNGFLSTLGFGGSPWEGNPIPYREDLSQDKTALVDYLKTHWLGHGWVHVSDRLRDEIVERVWEIYANAFEHGQSSVGIFSCGQRYPSRRELKLTVVDFGVGIPSNVRMFFRHDPRAVSLNTASCLKWAFQRGTTTKPNGTSRGMGLDLLKEFVKLNKGKLKIFNHEGYALIDESHEIFMNRQTFFKGTLVNITLRCDESYYHFASETTDEPLF
jgi:hypothetical protein